MVAEPALPRKAAAGGFEGGRGAAGRVSALPCGAPNDPPPPRSTGEVFGSRHPTPRCGWVAQTGYVSSRFRSSRQACEAWPHPACRVSAVQSRRWRTGWRQPDCAPGGRRPLCCLRYGCGRRAALVADEVRCSEAAVLHGGPDDVVALREVRQGAVRCMQGWQVGGWAVRIPWCGLQSCSRVATASAAGGCRCPTAASVTSGLQVAQFSVGLAGQAQLWGRVGVRRWSAAGRRLPQPCGVCAATSGGTVGPPVCLGVIVLVRGDCYPGSSRTRAAQTRPKLQPERLSVGPAPITKSIDVLLGWNTRVGKEH